MSLSPLLQYEHLLDAGEILPDAEQHKVLIALDALWHEIQQPPPARALLAFGKRKSRGVRGMYIWGGVGRGKTWLMDLFYENLPIENK